MKIRHAAILPLLLVLLPSSAHAITIERIAAIAGDDVITVQDLREEGALRYMVKGKDITYIDYANDREKKLEELTRELVQARLIARQAKKNDIHVGDREVDMQLQAMIRRTGQTEATFKEMLKQEGIDWNAYRGYLRSEIEAQYVVRSELSGNVEPSEADVVACAQEAAPGAERGIAMTLSQILIREVKADSAAGHAAPIASKLNAAWWNSLDETLERYAYGVYDETVKHPERFVEYVHKFSSGRSVERDGVLGTLSPGDLSSEFNVVFTLDKGSIAPIVTTASGYHILRVDDVTEGENENWKIAMNQCREQLRLKEGQRLTESWLSDLVEKNYVSITVNQNIRQSEP